jgi:hypothetical protein
MSVKFSKPNNRLAARIGRKGVSRDEATASALVNVETLREPTVDYIDENLSYIVTNYRTYENTARPIGPLYEASNAIAGTAALFGLDALGKGAFSFCALLCCLEKHQSWNAAAVQVHVDGMRMMRQFKSNGSQHEAELILDNLAKLLTHVSGDRAE